MCGGGSSPKSRSTVGAMSTMPGSCVSIFSLQKKMPGTMRGSTMWSPLHALTLSSNTGPEAIPVAQSHDVR